ncbi:MAG: hypothetical protein OEZ22_13835 [Spirochaetia bacterium]|nr:hypothetical protein [Spirochaetia bacterium]
MNSEFLEETTKSGIIIRVNVRKGNYLVFKNNKPIVNSRLKGRSVIHNLFYVVFLGAEFDLSMNTLDKIGFYQVKSNQIHIPFNIKGLSDIRHLKLPTYIDSETLPAVVSYYKSFNLGLLPRSVSDLQYFVVSEQIDRELLVRLKIQFPKSRVIVFRQERDISVDFAQPEEENASLPGDIRAVDLLNRDDVGELSKNPVFSSRVYLRKLDFLSMYSLPLKYILNGEDAVHIKTFLEVMLKKIDENADIKRYENEIKELINFYDILGIFLSFQVLKVEQFFDKGLPDRDVLEKLQTVLVSQKRLRAEEGDNARNAFFDNALSMLQPILPKDTV